MRCLHFKRNAYSRSMLIVSFYLSIGRFSTVFVTQKLQKWPINRNNKTDKMRRENPIPLFTAGHLFTSHIYLGIVITVTQIPTLQHKQIWSGVS